LGFKNLVKGFEKLYNKVVIPAAGLGSRLLPATKEMPKEMLPIFTSGVNGELCVKPLLHVIFEQLYDVGIRDFCFIVGKGKGSITDHFTSDKIFLRTLFEVGKQEIAKDMTLLYERVKSSSFVFVSQPEPKGFGDAILKAKPYIREPFVVQAGDTLILSDKNHHLSRLMSVHESCNSVATFFVKEVDNPRPFGIIEGKEIEKGKYIVEKVVEKPKKPKSNLAIIALYLFDTKIFKALESTSEGVGGEFHLTDGIEKLIESGYKVTALRLEKEEEWLDIGSPETYWDALRKSHLYAQNKRSF
jgi:UTP--glucose-1-phosphate uridylyltransferase